MKPSHNSLILKFFFISLFCFASNIAFANTLLCLKKEISNDGTNWQDANTELNAVSINGIAHFKFTAYSCNLEEFGGVQGIELFDNQLAISNFIMGDLLPAIIDESGNPTVTPLTWTTAIADYCADYEGAIENIAKVEGFSMKNGDKRVGTDNAWAMCEPEIEIGGEGCTPGYWKQVHHLRSWPTFAFKRFSSVFGRNITIKLGKKRVLRNPSLFAVLWAKGGKVNASARHAVAAYLNALSNDVNYDLTADSVIEGFQTSFDNGDLESFKDSVEEYNQQGCPLN